MKTSRLLIALACSLGACNVGFARVTKPWSYETLTSEADLIVIATPLAVRDSSEKTTFPGIQRGNDSVAAVGLETTFDILSVFKGDKDANKIVFYHLREENPPLPQANGPRLVSFKPQDRRRYLLFLKKEKDGRYSSVTGQVDPVDGIKDLGIYP